MDARRETANLRGWAPLIIACVLLTGALAYLVSGVLPKSYEARSSLIVGQSLSAVNPDYSQLLASQQLLQTYVDLATTRPLLEHVIEELDLEDTPEELVERLEVSATGESSLLSIIATDPDPEVAAEIANALAAQVIQSSPELQGQEAAIRDFVLESLADTQEQIEATQATIVELAALPERTAAQEAQLNLLQGRLISLRSSYSALLSYASTDASNLVTIVEPAVAPLEPVAPRPLLNALLAAILGLLVVLLILFVVSWLDDGVKDAEQAEEATGLPTLGTVPRMRTERGHDEMYRIAMLLYPRSAAAEAYRTLRTNLEFASVDAPIRTLLVTSPAPGEGKTVTAANLAVAYAQAGRRVLLVDADLRKPGVHAIFKVGNTRGLSALLKNDDASWESVVQSTEHANLRLLTTGQQPPNPAELLGSQRMRAVLQRLTEGHDLIIVDSPPLLAVTDSLILASFVDGTLLVVDSRRSSRKAAGTAREALARAGARVLGVLLNGVPPQQMAAYGSYYESETGQADAARSPEPTNPPATT